MSDPRSTYIIGTLDLQTGKTVEVFRDRIVIKSPSLRVENRLTLTHQEAEQLADLLLKSIPRDSVPEDEASDFDDEVVQ